MSELTSILEPPRQNRVSFIRKASVWIQNIGCTPNMLSLWWLGRQFRKHADYRYTWQSNIAMPILDASAGKEMTHELANQIADDLMKHLFKA